eukprot:s369_g7.t1
MTMTVPCFRSHVALNDLESPRSVSVGFFFLPIMTNLARTPKRKGAAIPAESPPLPASKTLKSSVAGAPPPAAPATAAAAPGVASAPSASATPDRSRPAGTGTSPAPSTGSPPAPLPKLKPRRSSQPPSSKTPSGGPKPLEIAIIEYAAKGELVHNCFENGQAAYVLCLRQSGTSKQNPSLLYLFKESVSEYLEVLHAENAETPAELAHLVPQLFSHTSPFIRHNFLFLFSFRLIFLSTLACQADFMQIHFAFGSAPGWAKSIYTGGGPDGPPAALEFLHNFAAWQQLKNPRLQGLVVDLWAPPAIDLTDVPRAAWTLRHKGASSADFSVYTAAPPSGRGHLTVSVDKTPLADYAVKLTGNTYPLRAHMEDLEVEGRNTTEGYERCTRALTYSNAHDTELVQSIGALLQGVFFILRIAADLPEEQASFLRGIFPQDA